MVGNESGIVMFVFLFSRLRKPQLLSAVSVSRRKCYKQNKCYIYKQTKCVYVFFVCLWVLVVVFLF